MSEGIIRAGCSLPEQAAEGAVGLEVPLSQSSQVLTSSCVFPGVTACPCEAARPTHRAQDKETPAQFVFGALNEEREVITQVWILTRVFPGSFTASCPQMISCTKFLEERRGRREERIRDFVFLARGVQTLPIKHLLLFQSMF